LVGAQPSAILCRQILASENHSAGGHDLMPPLADYRAATLVALLLTFAIGCAPEMAGLRQSFAHPGPAAYQRAQAIQHDPYVLNDVGPEVVGGRPREYMIPINEVERARLAANRPANLSPVPPVVLGPATGPAPPFTPAPAPVPLAPIGPPAGAPIVTTPASLVPAVPTAPGAPPSSFPAQNRAPY
jgi:hypothetical protein